MKTDGPSAFDGGAEGDRPVPSEQEFTDRAITHLCTLSGMPLDALGPDTPLQATGWFDSLMLVSFLDFVETQRGSPLRVSAETGLPLEDLETVRTAYRLVLAP
jgi:hypothetical protein